MNLADLPTPCLVLDRAVLLRNIQRMAQAATRAGLPLRPHMKTAKSIEVARLATAGQPGGITVSTLAEAEYFTGHGVSDILLATAITPDKLAQVAKLQEAGAAILVATDDLTVAAAIAARPEPIRALIEIDCGEGRGGIDAESPALLEIAERLGPRLAGVMTHGGQSYAGRSEADMAAVAEAECAAANRAASRLREAGHAAPIVSIGSTPTVLAADRLVGPTELRAGVYMFGDLFQAGIGSHGPDDIAVTVLASVIGRRTAENALLVDAGGIALSKDRSTQALPRDWGFGRVLDRAGGHTLGDATVTRAWQEHGLVQGAKDGPSIDRPVGEKLRIAPNHVCMTAAAHDRYFVVEGSEEVVAVWTRVNGW
jgi:D-serine deaminase-like pyridoxal phosphate-dependent protein